VSDIDDMMKRPMPRSAPEGKTLILVLPDGNIRPVPATWMATEDNEFQGLRAAEAETGGTLVYVPEMQVEGVPHHELPRYDIGSGVFLPPDPSTVRAEWVRQSRAALNGSDWVLAKVTEEGFVLAQTWRDWRQTLRNIINGADGPVPEQPSYREGGNVQMDKPADIEIPRFLAPDSLEGIPSALLDLAEPGETVAEMQARLWELWREMNGKLMLNIATPEEIALHTRLHNELHWIAPPLEGDE
jgi:hypothetical protein